MDDVAMPLSIMVGLVGVLCMALGLAPYYGARWTVISEDIAPVVALLGLFAILCVIVMNLIRK